MTLLRIAAAACVLLAVWRAPAAGSGPATDYVHLLHSIATHYRAAAGAKVIVVPADPAIPPAPVPGPPRFAPSLGGWVRASLNSIRSAPRRERAAMLRRLADALDEAAAQTRSDALPATIARDPAATAAAILTRSEYHRGPSAPSPLPDLPWWYRLGIWVSEQVNRLIAALFAASSRSGANVAVLILVLAALALAVILVVMRLVRYFAARPKSARGEADGEALPAPADVDALFEAARAAAARGDFRRAATALFSTAIGQLDRTHVVPLDPSRTAGEYRRAVRRAAASAAASFEGVASAFTMAAYAERPLGESDWRAAADAYARFSAALAPQAR